jgi:hypothetical protein
MFVGSIEENRLRGLPISAVGARRQSPSGVLMPFLDPRCPANGNASQDSRCGTADDGADSGLASHGLLSIAQRPAPTACRAGQKIGFTDSQRQLAATE